MPRAACMLQPSKLAYLDYRIHAASESLEGVADVAGARAQYY